MEYENKGERITLIAEQIEINLSILKKKRARLRILQAPEPNEGGRQWLCSKVPVRLTLSLTAGKL